MPQLYTKLQALDGRIADKYFALTNDKPDVQIDRQGASDILKIARNGNKMTDKELDAITLLLQNDIFTTDAKKVIEQNIVTELVTVALKDPQAKGRLLKPNEVSQVLSALSVAAANVNFVSPGTRLSYDADKYESIKVLITDNDIMLIATNGGRQPGSSGVYDGKSNALFLFEDGSGALNMQRPIVVHELTHAVQDFVDIVGLRKYTETDAKIAQSICARVVGSSFYEEREFLGAAVDMAVKGQASLSNDKWAGVYENTANVVAQAYINDPRDVDFKRSDSSNEMEKMKKIINDIQVSQAAQVEAKLLLEEQQFKPWIKTIRPSGID